MLGERLGKARRLAYALVVDAKGTEIARVARRGVKVISLSGSRAKYPQVLGVGLPVRSATSQFTGPSRK